MQTPSKSGASFTCKRKELSSALSSVKLRKNANLSIETHLAEQKITLKTAAFELPVACSDCKGSDAVISLPLTGLKNYCKLVPDETLRFALDGNELQINTTILTVKVL